MRLAVPIAAVLLIVALAALPLDYGFYNPPKGTAATGRAETPVDPHARELLRIAISDADVARFNGKVTLRALSDLYGTNDSLPCSVQKTYGNDNAAAANWPIAAGTTVSLCLN